MTAMRGTKPSSGRTRALTSHHRGPDQVGEAGEPLLEGSLRVHDDLELAARQAAHAPLAGAERDDDLLAVDPDRIGDREDLVDLAHADGVEQCAASGTLTDVGGRPIAARNQERILAAWAVTGDRRHRRLLG